MCLSLSSQSCFSRFLSLYAVRVYFPFSVHLFRTLPVERQLQRQTWKDSLWKTRIHGVRSERDNRSRSRNGETLELLPFLLCFSSVKVVRERKSLNRSNHFLSFLFLSNFLSPFSNQICWRRVRSLLSLFFPPASSFPLHLVCCHHQNNDETDERWRLCLFSFFIFPSCLFSLGKDSFSLLTLANNDAQVNCFSSSLPARLSGNIIIDNDDDRSSLSS